jgi:hypothetical protein
VALSFEDKGEQQVKNIARPVRVYALGSKTIAELPADHDEEDLAAVEAAEPRRWPRISVRKTLRWSLVALVLVAIAGPGAWRVVERFGKATGMNSARDVAQSSAPTVAVLSFDNLTGDPAQDYFSDGLSAELNTVISQYEPLRVLAREPRSRVKPIGWTTSISLLPCLISGRSTRHGRKFRS